MQIISFTVGKCLLCSHIECYQKTNYVYFYRMTAIWQLAVNFCLLVTYLEAVTTTPESQYNSVKALTTDVHFYLTIPVTSSNCCFNWCNGNAKCDGFVFELRSRKCSLMKPDGDVWPESIAATETIWIKNNESE